MFIGQTELLPVESLQEDSDAYKSEFGIWLNEVWLPEQAEIRADILGLHANEKRFLDLLSATRRGQVVPFVGSGMSVPSGLPTWSNLLRKINEFTKVAPQDLEELLSTSLFEEAADLLAGGTNARLLDERIEHDLRIEDPSYIDGSVRLLPAVFSHLVITTNLDDVLEHVYGSTGTNFKYVLAGKELARYRAVKDAHQRFLLKLHGDCRRADSRVLLSAEYDAAYSRGNSTREELELLYRSNNLLFLGCSLGFDRTLRLVEEVGEADPGMPKHYAFVSLPEDDESRMDREQYLTGLGIYPIWYQWDHDESIQALLAGLITVEAVRET